MQQHDNWLPLFPLKTVLFPEGILPLRVFEIRYIDMVRDCLRQGVPFGVVLIRSGQEVGMAADPEDAGTLASILDWDMESVGLMTLRTLGGERFRIIETRVRQDQRLEARVEMIPPDPVLAPDSIHVTCATALKSVIDNIEIIGKTEQGAGYASPFTRPLRLDSAAWVANRWCELLPIPLDARQKLLLEDARNRLSIIHQYLQQHGII